MRIALYFAPAPSHPLWAAGCTWLGRRADDVGTADKRPGPEVATPWRYGFHATLKAPMRLAEGRNVQDVVASVKRLASRHAAFDMPALKVDQLAGFVALRPVDPLPHEHPLHRLADDAVFTLDAYRAPLDDVERARQMKPGLSARQAMHVARHGYAHVLEDWRFHMTLSRVYGPDDEAARRATMRAAEVHFASALAVPLRCDHVCIVQEPAAVQPFELRHRIALGAA